MEELKSNNRKFSKLWISNYFAKKIVKVACLKFSTLHSEALSTDIDSINPFLEHFYAVSKDFKESDILNFDETSLYIKDV